MLRSLFRTLPRLKLTSQITAKCDSTYCMEITVQICHSILYLKFKFPHGFGLFRMITWPWNFHVNPATRLSSYIQPVKTAIHPWIRYKFECTLAASILRTKYCYSFGANTLEWKYIYVRVCSKKGVCYGEQDTACHAGGGVLGEYTSRSLMKGVDRVLNRVVLSSSNMR